MLEYFRIAFDLSVGLLGLLIITKILGKTQITQITAFDFISALVLGELVGNATFDQNVGILQILFAILVLGILIYVIEIITQKVRKTRPFLEGKPSIIIHKGKIIREHLKKNKLDINQLQHLLRSKGVFSIREAEYAILETDGSISVLKKSPYEPPTRQDYKMADQKVRLPITLVSDGVLIEENLKESGFSESWLQSELKSQGVATYKDLLFAEWREEEGLYVQEF
ncbi:DUF421 domain-containing protein [Bacillus sp. JJ1533]|uniref:DUF421 domain-containing protein n=1 Tax=Bacillus sp. JJ1533 TaxID=3122959 RepID=UPI002FFD80B8